MFILAYVVALIVNANWTDIPHAAIVILAIFAIAETLIYVIGAAVWGTAFFTIFKAIRSTREDS